MVELDSRKYGFTDGVSLYFDCRSLELGVWDFRKEDSEPTELGAYGDVVLSKEPVIVRMPAGPLPERNKLFVGPVTVRDVMEAMLAFYSTELSEREHLALESWSYGFDYPMDIRKDFKKYGDLQYGHVFEGFKMDYKKKNTFRQLSKYKPYEITWGS